MNKYGQSIEERVNVMKSLAQYWLQIVKLPSHTSEGAMDNELLFNALARDKDVCRESGA